MLLLSYSIEHSHVFATVNANERVLNILVLSQSFVLLVPQWVILLVCLILSLNSKDLVVQVLRLVGSSDILFKCSWWHNSRGIPLNDWIKSLKRNFAIFFSTVLIKSGAYLDNLSDLVRYSRTVILPCTNCWNSMAFCLLTCVSTYLSLTAS